MSSAFQGCQTETTAANNFIKGKPSHCQIHDCFLLLHRCIVQNVFCFVVNEKAATDDKSHRMTSSSFLLQIGCAGNHTDLRQSSWPLLAEFPTPAPLFSSFSGFGRAFQLHFGKGTQKCCSKKFYVWVLLGGCKGVTSVNNSSVAVDPKKQKKNRPAYWVGVKHQCGHLAAPAKSCLALWSREKN